MTHKDAGELSPEQQRFEAFWKSYKKAGFVGFSRDAEGNYHTEFLRDTWKMWEVASRGVSDAEYERVKDLAWRYEELCK